MAVRRQIASRASDTSDALCDGTGILALAWVVMLAFLRLTTKPQVIARPFRVGVALEVVDGWFARPDVVVHHTTARRAPIRRAGAARKRSNLTPDAHLAALAVERGADL